jgi:hypothetical protein
MWLVSRAIVHQVRILVFKQTFETFEEWRHNTAEIFDV